MSALACSSVCKQYCQFDALSCTVSSLMLFEYPNHCNEFCSKIHICSISSSCVVQCCALVLSLDLPHHITPHRIASHCIASHHMPACQPCCSQPSSFAVQVSVDNIDADLFGRGVAGGGFQPSDDTMHLIKSQAIVMLRDAYDQNMVRQHLSTRCIPLVAPWPPLKSKYPQIKVVLL